MAYAVFQDYIDLYGEGVLDKTGFNRLLWEAERVMDNATTGIDGVRKLSAAMPTDEYGAAAVKRCACILVETLRQIDEAERAARKAASYIENDDGTVQARLVASRSSGSESISYAAGSSSKTGAVTAIDAAAGDTAAREKLLSDTVYKYLSFVPDANGVNLTYMGAYPKCIETP